ncbi:MAG: response regulator [Desulfovibrio sp.]|nr:response regulator [Desulfovibrio sp.]
MKNQQRLDIKILIIGVGVLFVLMFASQLILRRVSTERILSRNESFLEQSSKDAAQYFNAFFSQAEMALKQSARSFARPLAGSRDAMAVRLKAEKRNTSFRELFFVYRSGVVMTMGEKAAYFPDRHYLIPAFSGRTDTVVVDSSAGAHRAILLFYTPVYEEEEGIVGALAGTIELSDLKDLLKTSYFDVPTNDYICDAQGRILVSTGGERGNVLSEEYLSKNAGADSRRQLQEAFERGESFSRTYDDKEGNASAFVMPLWHGRLFLVKTVPSQFNAKILSETNCDFMMAFCLTSVIFILVMVALVSVARRQEKQLKEKNVEAFKIINSVQRMYVGFCLLDFAAGTYTFLDETDEGMRTGSGEEAFAAWRERFCIPAQGENGGPENPQAACCLVKSGPLSDFHDHFRLLCGEKASQELFALDRLAGGEAFNQTEYRIAGRDDHWEKASLIATAFRDGRVAQALLALQDITSLKLEEQKTQQRLRLALEGAEQQKVQLEKLNRKIEEHNLSLRLTLTQEEQYRQAIISESISVYNVNVSLNLLEDEIYERINGKSMPIVSLMGYEIPCRASSFFRRWAELHVAEYDRETYLKNLDVAYLLDAYRLGRTELTFEYQCTAYREKPAVLRHTLLLIRVPTTGDIIAMCSIKDVTETRAREESTAYALKEAYAAAMQASSAKTDFLSRMSHDIRTPLNGITGMTEIALQHMDDPARVGDCLKKIALSGRHLLQLVNEVLDMSRIESGTIKLSEKGFSLNKFFEGLDIMFRPQAEVRGQKFILACEGVQHVNVMGDEFRLMQICSNILGNAVKFTPEGGHFGLEAAEVPSTLAGYYAYRFVFSDSGMGMSPEFVKHIFEPFTRATDSRTSKIEGTGLGMAIVHSLVNLMNGTITVESAPGEGSTFTLSLSLKADTDASAEEKEGGAAAQGPEGKADGLEGRKLLIVDDNEMNREIAVELLQAVGFDIDTACDGQEGVDKVCSAPAGRYDLVLMDVQMPVMDGYAATRAIRANGREDLARLPIVAMTANAFSDDVHRALEAGMNAHISKPIEVERVCAVIAEVLREAARKGD